MWKGLSIFAGILLLVAAGINYMVMQQMQRELDLKQTAEKNAADSKRHLTDSIENVSKNEKELKTEQGLAAQQNRDLNEAKAKRETTVKKLEEETAKLDVVRKNKMELDKQLADLGGLETIVQELKELAAKKQENEAKIQEKEAAQTLALQRKQNTETSIAALKKRDLMQKTGLMNDGFSGSISNIDPQWGFIMINRGNASNVVKNAKLDVKRGSDKIATLVVTNVQPNAAICDIVPGSLAENQLLQVGDRVVVNDASSEKNLANPSSNPGDAAAAPAGPAAAPSAPAAADPFAPAAAPSAPAAPDPFAPSAPAAPGPEAAVPAN
jgi:myosin heavy subunit